MQGTGVLVSQYEPRSHLPKRGQVRDRDELLPLRRPGRIRSRLCCLTTSTIELPVCEYCVVCGTYRRSGSDEINDGDKADQGPVIWRLSSHNCDTRNCA